MLQIPISPVKCDDHATDFLRYLLIVCMDCGFKIQINSFIHLMLVMFNRFPYSVPTGLKNMIQYLSIRMGMYENEKM